MPGVIPQGPPSVGVAPRSRGGNALGRPHRAESLLTTNGTDEQGTEFYVSISGDDAWSGRLARTNQGRTDGPFRTLARARDRVRALKAREAITRPVTIYVRGGVYPFEHPLLFTSEDSGTSEYTITYAAYPGEVPVLSGGRQITGWKCLHEVTRPRPTSRDAPTGSSSLWMARVPGVKERKWYFRQLFVNGERRQRARTPNQGFFQVDGEISPEQPARFKFRDGDLRLAWAEQGDVEVVALLKWAEFRMPLKAVDKRTQTVTLSQKRQAWGDEKNPRYWVENTLDSLDAPGEWYLERSTGRLYYRPMAGEDMTRAQVIAPFLQNLIRFEGDVEAGHFVHNIALEGLSLSYTDWSLPVTGYVDTQAAYDVSAAVEGLAAHSCSILKCVFTHLGEYAIAFGKGSKENRIVGNEMTDLGAGGVKIGDPKDPNEEDEETSRNVISDNKIHDIGIVYPAAVGVWVGQSSDNTISHNDIHDTFYTAISVGWTWGYGPTAARGNVIEFNHLHHIGRGMLSDLGCIYTLGVQPGTVLRNNLCHDVTRYEHGYGAWGIYTDEGSSGIVIENNLVYRAQDGGFHQHYGGENIVRNNIFAMGEEAQIRRTRDEPHLSFTFAHNVVYWEGGQLLSGKWDDNHYRFERNLYFRPGGAPITFGNWSFEEWQKRGQDVESLIADPLFVDAKNGDFSLKGESPALKMGFRPIDVSKVGPRHE